MFKINFSLAKGKAPGSEAVRQAIRVLEGRAIFDEPKVHLYNRVGWHDENLYYDLADNKGWVVKIYPGGWSICENPKIHFRRYEHHEAQVEPDLNGDIGYLIQFLNLYDNKLIPLELVYIISCFISDIPHPIHVSFGPQGSAKSTQDRMKRRLIDPSANDIQTLTSRIDQTVLTLSQNHFSPFDNISRINEETSDLLCRASTGASYSKKALYTDEETIIQKLGCCVSLNGINSVINKPDLMDRSILFEYARIPKSKRKEEKEIFADFEKVKPKILGGIFDILAKSIKLKPTIKINRVPRMADFCIWGAAISEAMGLGANKFLDLYERNITQQNQEIANSNPVAVAIRYLMDNTKSWSGNMSKLYSDLSDMIERSGINARIDNKWPKSANAFSRKLGELETTLHEIGIKISRDRTSNERTITISKSDGNDA